MPKNMDDTSATHPFFKSMENCDGHATMQVSLFSYRRHKFDLYTIASPIIGDIYNFKTLTASTVAQQAVKINTDLVKWFDGLPPELRLDSDENFNTTGLSSAEIKTCQLFQLQALALQLAYDNIQIVFHRPFLRYNYHLSRSPGLPESDARATSLEQCRHCALRTCNILPRYTKVLLAARNTHAVAYIAMQNFTAGVTLGMVALSDLGSEQSQDAKRGVANSISLQRILGGSSIVPLQTVKILEELFRLIFSKEMVSMLDNFPSDVEDSRVNSSLRRGRRESEFLAPPFEQPQDLTSTFQPSRNIRDAMGPLQTSNQTEDTRQQAVDTTKTDEPDIYMSWDDLSPNSGIDRALESIQQGISSLAFVNHYPLQLSLLPCSIPLEFKNLRNGFAG